MRFIFSGINWRNSTDHPIESVLVDDICRLLNKERKTECHNDSLRLEESSVYSSNVNPAEKLTDVVGKTRCVRAEGIYKEEVCGIHLGFKDVSVCGIDKSGLPQMISNLWGEYSIPAVMYVENDDSIIIGREATQYMKIEADKTISVTLKDLSNPYYSRYINGREIKSIDALESILKSIMKEANEIRAIKKLPEIKKAVIAVPDYLDSRECELIMQITKKVGINVIDFLKESVAEVLGLHMPYNIGKTMLVYNLGKESFCVSIVQMKRGHIEMISEVHDNYLGTSDWDKALIDWVLMRSGYDIAFEDIKSEEETSRLLLAAESSRRKLMKLDNVPFMFTYHRKLNRVEISKGLFVDLTDELVQMTLNRVGKAVRNANIINSQVDEVIMVGEAIEMPGIMDGINNIFSCAIRSDIKSESTIAEGAALYAVKMIENG